MVLTEKVLGTKGWGLGTFAIVGQGFGKGYVLPSWSKKTQKSLFKASLGVGMQNHPSNPLSFKSSIFYKRWEMGWQGFFTWEQSVSSWKNHFYQGYIESPILPEADGGGYVRLGIHAQYATLLGGRMSAQFSKSCSLWTAAGWNIEKGGTGMILALKLDF